MWVDLEVELTLVMHQINQDLEQYADWSLRDLEPEAPSLPCSDFWPTESMRQYMFDVSSCWVWE